MREFGGMLAVSVLRDHGAGVGLGQRVEPAQTITRR